MITEGKQKNHDYIYCHNVLQICVQHPKERNYNNGLISKLFLCNFDV